jgi:hypothetical protein
MEAGEKPTFAHWADDKLLPSIYDRIPFFLRENIEGDTVVGEAAARYRYEQLVARKGKGEKINVSETKVFEVFGHLLSADLRKEATRLCTEIMHDTQRAVMPKASSGPEASTSRSGPKRQKTQASAGASSSASSSTDVDKMVLNLFA